MDRKVARHLYYNTGYKDISGVDGLEIRLTALENDNAVTTTTSVTSSTYTVLGTEELIIANRGAGIAMALPTVASAGIGFGFLIKNTGAGAVVLTPNGSETIDGAANLSLAQNQAAHIVATAAGVWRTVNTDLAAIATVAVNAAVVTADIPHAVADAITAADIQGDVDAAIAASADIALIRKALDADIVMVIAPGTATKSAGAAGWTQAVTVTFKTAAGATHTWLNDAIGVTVADTAAVGTATVSSATPAVTAGVATFNIVGDAVAWAENETATATIAALTVLGKSITGGTCVVTITA